MKLGVFGGTFNPIHFGHLRVAEETRESLGFDKVLFIPSGNPPLKTSDIAAARQRYEMTVRAVSCNNRFEVLDTECRQGKSRSYTVRTLEKLVKIYGNDELYLMLGIDAFLDMPKWYQPEKLMSLADFVIFARPGYRFADLASSPYLRVAKGALRKFEAGEAKSVRAEITTGREAALLRVTPLGISATDIRSRIKRGLSIKYLLPAEIESYIISKKIYALTKQGKATRRRECL
jgi:nicotinate-nucleotide adenylyltransferase